MTSFTDQMAPSASAFAADPFGYSALAWQKWAIAQNVAGFDIDPTRPPTSHDLKSPILWLTQAHAMSEAATIVLRGQPNIDHLPMFTKGVCHSQYCAVGLMLVGYSLEICLKAMLILTRGIDIYIEEEKTHKHHNLVRLSECIPSLDVRDKAILELLTHYLMWAGRYPDPGSGRESSAEAIFSLSEHHQIAARDLFELAARIMGHVRMLTK